MTSIGNNSNTILKYYWTTHPKLKEYFLDYTFFYSWMHTPSSVLRTEEDNGRTPWEIFNTESADFIQEYLESTDISSLYSARRQIEFDDDQLIRRVWLDNYEILWLGPKFEWSFEKFKKWMTTKGVLDENLKLPWNIDDGIEFIGLSPAEICQIEGYCILDIYVEDEEFGKENWEHQIEERKKLILSGKNEALRHIWEKAYWVQEYFKNREEFNIWMTKQPVRPKSNFLFKKKILPVEEKKMSSYDLWVKYGYLVLGLLMGRSLHGRKDL